MKEHLKELFKLHEEPLQGLNITREYLQALILESLQRAGAMVPLAFHGGTALRFLFASDRYSEDLDFALERKSKHYDFRAYLLAIKSDLLSQGYQIELKVNDKKVVHNALLRFPGLLFELGLSPHPSQTLSIKIEVDTNPPTGATLTTSLIRRHFVLRLQHHDQASLLAGKIHAVLQRPYVKGRDLYDLFWYLSDRAWPLPNFGLLNNALTQTGWTGETLTEKNWRRLLTKRLQTLPWDQVCADVAPFLPTAKSLEFLCLKNLLELLTGK